jgi:hypothetical protein
MHRLACFRDDIIFLIYLYQRYVYRVDPLRRNEFGQIASEAADVASKKPRSSRRSKFDTRE